MNNVVPTFVLQSGFLCSTAVGLTQPAEQDQTVAHDVLQVHRDQAAGYMYAQELDRLFKQYINNPQVIRQFDFRQAYLKEVIRLFNTLSFKNWVYMQAESPVLTHTGMEFLLDTFNYILTGRRNLSPVNWASLVTASPTTAIPDSRKLLRVLQCYFGDIKDSTIYAQHQIMPAGLHDLIQAWVSQPDGMMDLVITTGIIFGDQACPTLR